MAKVIKIYQLTEYIQVIDIELYCVNMLKVELWINAHRMEPHSLAIIEEHKLIYQIHDNRSMHRVNKQVE